MKTPTLHNIGFEEFLFDLDHWIRKEFDITMRRISVSKEKYNELKEAQHERCRIDPIDNAILFGGGFLRIYERPYKL